MKLTDAHALRPRRKARGGDVAFPEAAHGIAELIVPFRPAGRKAAHLVSARPAVPWLGNQLHRFEDRVLAAGLEKAALIVEAVWLARENRPEVEPEAVDVRFGHPIAQAIGHHLDHARVAEVQGVAGPGVV